ncbi:MAG: hypothetical protein IJT36_02175 [Alphaproteobacteria bacterium]|nr:hypothetical protein [Alphaproteobacteria bacterium]
MFLKKVKYLYDKIFFDFTPIKVCHNPCTNTHKTFKGIAKRGYYLQDGFLDSNCTQS